MVDHVSRCHQPSYVCMTQEPLSSRVRTTSLTLHILIPAHQPSGDRDDVSVRKFDGLETASVTQALWYDDDDDTGAMFLEVLWQCEMAAGGGAENNDKLGSTRQGTAVQWQSRIASSDFFANFPKIEKLNFHPKIPQNLVEYRAFGQKI